MGVTAVVPGKVTFRSVEALLRPRSIALVGASESAAGGWSRAIFENLGHTRAPIPVYPVNPKRETVWGERCYPSLDALPEPADLALVIMPAPAIAPVLRNGLEHGLRAATIYAAGFGEGGDPEGGARAAELKALSDAGLRICGPNCMGTLSVGEGLYLYPAPRVRDVGPGNVALVMQSGGLLQYWLQYAAARGLGFTYAVSSGNELDLDLADYINFFVDDERTQVICCLAEGIHRPDAFREAASRALAAAKPVLLVKIGRSEGARRAAASHTGSLAGDDRVFDAVCERYGIVRCGSLDEMIEAALVFRARRFPSKGRVAMVGYSGAARGLALDAADAAGLTFAKLGAETIAALQPHLDPGTNLECPLDLGPMASRDFERYSRICRIVLDDPGVAALAVQGQLPLDGESAEPRWFAEIAQATSKPVFAYARTGQNVTASGRAFQDRASMSFVQRIPETIRVAAHLMRYGDRLRRPPVEREARSDAADVESALQQRGVETPRTRFVRTAAEAVSAARELRTAVALKLHAPGPLHKTELGGVALDLDSDDAVTQAAEELLEIGRRHPELCCDGLLVQEMVSGLETIVGARNDAQFGPILVVGLGGVFVEAFNDVAIRLLPIEERDVHAMLEELRGKRLFAEFRGRQARDVDAWVRAVVAVSDVFVDRAETLDDLEINPLIVLGRGEGVRAVDIRSVPRGLAR
jgi:acetyltransferase